MVLAARDEPRSTTAPRRCRRTRPSRRRPGARPARSTGRGCSAPFSRAEGQLSRALDVPTEAASSSSQVVARVRGRDEAPAGPQDARELARAPVEVGDVVEHPGRDDAVERRVLEREILDVADPRVDAALTRELDHPRREVDRDDIARRARRAIRAASSPAPHPTSRTVRGRTRRPPRTPTSRASRPATFGYTERRAARPVSVAYCGAHDGRVVRGVIAR